MNILADWSDIRATVAETKPLVQELLVLVGVERILQVQVVQ